jgi:hypothetical protein
LFPICIFSIRDLNCVTLAAIQTKTFNLLLSWAIVFAVLSMLLTALVWFPISRIGAHYQMGYNEGFNAYWEQAASGGSHVYGKLPTVAYANYPPLSFHAVGWLGGVIGDHNIAGRWISFLAYLAIGGFIAALVFELTGRRRHAVYACLAWLIWLAAFDPTRIGFNDPHMLGMALGLCGLYCYVRNSQSIPWLVASAVLFALSLFTKQSLVAFPAAVGLHSLLISRKRFGIWLAASAGSALALLLLTFQVDGPYFLQHLSLPRTYSLTNLAGPTIEYVLFFQAPLAAALVLLLRIPTAGMRSVPVLAFVLAHAVGIVYTAGTGAAINHLFDALVSVCLIVGLALPDIELMAGKLPHPAAFLAVCLLFPFFLSPVAIIPQRIPDDWNRFQARSQMEASFAAAQAFVRGRAGDAMCESLLVCYAADKPVTWDPFVIGQLIHSKRLDERRVLSVLANHGFSVIEIDLKYNEQLDSREHISPSFTKQLLASYQLAQRTPDFALFVPRLN